MTSKIIGYVDRVEALPKKEGKEALHTISIEGVSMLYRDGSNLPVRDQEIEATFNVQWRGKKQKPIWWLRSWEAVRSVVSSL